jgi:hypothetical protein
MLTAPRVHRDRRYSGMAWRRARDFTLARDHYTCQACGRTAATERERRILVADHRIPVQRWQGAFADTTNLWTLCKACNNSKGDMTVEEWYSSAQAPSARSGRQGASYAAQRSAPAASPRLIPERNPNGRPSSGDTRAFIAWVLDLPGVGGPPDDHDHGKWDVLDYVMTGGQTYRVCPQTCSSPVRWRAA